MFLSYDTAEAFAVKRNPSLSFPFLKENGELLSICVNAGILIEPRALNLYQDFYSNAYKLTERYPQYYRFTLGMILDLERGGMRGDESRKIAQFVTDENLVEFDTSDVRKLETLTMLEQAGQLCPNYQRLYDDIVARIEGFIKNPDWFMKFNKPLFYDLTHIVFFLTDFGSKAAPLKNDIHSCLIYMGLLAILDNDADLLSEVCLCLKYLALEIPKFWDDYLSDYAGHIRVTFDESVASSLNPSVDEYHIYLVLNAYLASQGQGVFSDKFHSRAPRFSLPNTPQSLLSKLSSFAHENAFKGQKGDNSLSAFISCLGESDINHWQKSLASTELSESLVRRFSGLN